MSHGVPIYSATAVDYDGVKRYFTIYRKQNTFLIFNEQKDSHVASGFRRLTPEDIREEITKTYGVRVIELIPCHIPADIEESGPIQEA